MVAEKPSILGKIQELKAMCMQAGRTPIILLINKEHYGEIQHVLSRVRSFRVSGPGIDATKLVEEVLDLNVIINDKITDFVVVDDRHWYEQKF